MQNISCQIRCGGGGCKQPGGRRLPKAAWLPLLTTSPSTSKGPRLDSGDGVPLVWIARGGQLENARDGPRTEEEDLRKVGDCTRTRSLEIKIKCVVWVELCSPKRHVGLLTPGTCECDLI